MNSFPVLTLLTLLPLIGGMIVAGIDSERRGLARGLALFFSGLGLMASLILCRFFQLDSGYQFEEIHSWIPALGVLAEGNRDEQYFCLYGNCSDRF